MNKEDLLLRLKNFREKNISNRKLYLGISIFVDALVFTKKIDSKMMKIFHYEFKNLLSKKELDKDFLFSLTQKLEKNNWNLIPQIKGKYD